MIVTAVDRRVVDRRRVELIEPGVPTAPVHQEGKGLDDRAVEAMLADVRASAHRATDAALAELAADVVAAIESMSLRAWPLEFPTDITVLRRAPYEAQADSVMYREVLAERARARGWDVVRFDAKDVERRARAVLGDRAHEVLDGPRAALGPPWTKDHRMALAATVVADMPQAE